LPPGEGGYIIYGNPFLADRLADPLSREKGWVHGSRRAGFGILSLRRMQRNPRKKH